MEFLKGRRSERTDPNTGHTKQAAEMLRRQLYGYGGDLDRYFL